MVGTSFAVKYAAGKGYNFGNAVGGGQGWN